MGIMMTESLLVVEILSHQGSICSTDKEDSKMSICQKGLDAKVKSQTFSVLVSKKDIFARLANAIDWVHVSELALPDLENTEKGCYWLGRKINLRIHLSVMILQPLLKETDRGIEEAIKNTPRYQAFCGKGIVSRWKCPDHTKIEEFRNRLTPETHKKIGDYILQLAHQLGFADPSWMDVDSTVQEANIAYPSDATLMKKLSEKCKKVLDYLVFTGKKYLPEGLNIDLKAIRKKACEYFFMAKNTALEKKRECFRSLHHLVKNELQGLIRFAEKISHQALCRLPWNIRKAVKQIAQKSWRYLLDVAHFVRTNKMKTGKVMAFHCQDVACISKGKAGKEHEFGRTFQLGRIGGNFLLAAESKDIRMPDKKNLIPTVEEHQKIFGLGVLKGTGTDKGYYSKRNVKTLEKMGIEASGVQRPRNCKNQVPEEIAGALRDRRSGMEPLIGHAKEFGLGTSKAKSDETTLASGYRSVMGFNTHQLKRKMAEAAKRKVA